MRPKSFTTESAENTKITEAEKWMGLHPSEFCRFQDFARHDRIQKEWLGHVAQEWWQVTYGD